MSDQKHLDQLASLLLSTILFSLHWKELQSTFYFHLCDNVRPNYSTFQIPVGSISAGQTLNLTFHLVYLWTWSRGAKVPSTSQLKSAQDKHPRYWDWRRLSLRCVAATGGQCNPGGGSNEAVDVKAVECFDFEGLGEERRPRSRPASILMITDSLSFSFQSENLDFKLCKLSHILFGLAVQNTRNEDVDLFISPLTPFFRCRAGFQLCKIYFNF